MISAIVKRDGRTVPFNKDKIAEAIFKAATSVGGKNMDVANDLADQVVEYLEKELGDDCLPSVEHVQDVVEKNAFIS